MKFCSSCHRSFSEAAWDVYIVDVHRVDGYLMHLAAFDDRGMAIRFAQGFHAAEPASIVQVTGMKVGGGPQVVSVLYKDPAGVKE